MMLAQFTGKAYFFIFIVCSFPIHAFAHGGGLDSSGGHHDRKNGGYHYHTGGSVSNPQTNQHSPSELHITFEGKTKATKSKKLKSGKKITKKVVLTGVSDGDTITVKLDGRKTNVRLYGIDCPESGQEQGRAAKRAISYILKGRNISVEILGYDRYDRALAIVYADGKSVNEILVRGGYAWVFEKYCQRDFCDSWSTYQDEARRSGRAIWSSSHPIPPWEWRRME